MWRALGILAASIFNRLLRGNLDECAAQNSRAWFVCRSWHSSAYPERGCLGACRHLGGILAPMHATLLRPVQMAGLLAIAGACSGFDLSQVIRRVAFIRRSLGLAYTVMNVAQRLVWWT